MRVNGKRSKRGASKAEKNMHEGEKVRRMLEEAGISSNKLAQAIGIHRSAVSRYLRTERFQDEAWQRAMIGLIRVGLDPRRIRKNADSPNAPDMRPYVDGFSEEQLRRLVDILKAPRESRETLLVFIERYLLRRDD